MSTRPAPQLRLIGVEGWRGVAAVLVVVMHVWTNQGHRADGYGPWMDNHVWATFVQNADVVLPIFFVLSGLLLWLPFAGAAFDDSRAVPHGGVFMLRRCLRFLPLYVLVVLIMWCRHNYNPHTADWLDLVEHLTFTQCFDSHRIFYTIGPAWTLAVEWYFYLSLAAFGPRLVRWIRRGGAAHWRLARMLLIPAALIALSVTFRWLVADVWHKPETDWAWRYGPLSKMDAFGVGMLAAVAILALGRIKLPGVLLPLIVVGAVATYWPAVVPSTGDHNTYNEVWRHLLQSSSIALVVFGLTTSRWTLPGRLIDNRILVGAGTLTYAIYIIHEGVIDTVEQFHWFVYTNSVAAFAYNLVLVLAITVPLAWFLHLTVELPWETAGFLVDRNGRRRELYPHLVNPTASDALYSQYLGHLRFQSGQYYEPSAASRLLTGKLAHGAIAHEQAAT